MSVLSLKPVVHAHVKRPCGRGRQSCAHIPTLSPQPLDVPADSEFVEKAYCDKYKTKKQQELNVCKLGKLNTK